MLERVEIRVPESELAENMKEMRTWLDSRRLEPNGFRCAANRSAVLIRVDFENRQDAAEFAQQFGGRVLDARAS